MLDNKLTNLFIKYELAQQQLKKIFNTLNEDYSKSKQDNPIEHLKYRIKTTESIKEKLNKLKYQAEKNNVEGNYEFSAENIEQKLDDIVGVRIVCPFLNDVEKVIKEIRTIQQDNKLIIVEERDYINNPKKSGYSSYHMKILVPIYIENKIEYVKAEIQIRTVTMDMLASLEHKITYKKSIILTEDKRKTMKNTFDFCNHIDVALNNTQEEKRENENPNYLSVQLPDFMKTREFNNFILAYEKALVSVNLKVIDYIKSYSKEQNPVEHIKTRMKNKDKIFTKLERYNLTPTLSNIENNIHDIAGIRIVCAFLSDVEEIVQKIITDDKLIIVEKQNYISNPKESGYSSYHLLVKVPIIQNNIVIYPEVEIQVRTMVQEMWATLQERLCYQKESEQSLQEELKKCSKVLNQIDENMNEIMKEANKLQTKKKTLSKKKIPNQSK